MQLWQDYCDVIHIDSVTCSTVYNVRCDQVSVPVMLISGYNQTSIYSGTNFNSTVFPNNTDALTQLNIKLRCEISDSYKLFRLTCVEKNINWQGWYIPPGLTLQMLSSKRARV